MSRPLTTGQIWGMPVILSLSTGVGLVSALLGDGAWDAVSWAALAAPVGVALWYIVRSRDSSAAGSSGPSSLD